MNLTQHYIIDEVKVYDDYLIGNVYMYYTTDKDGDVIDGCGGFFNHDFGENGLLEEAKSYINAYISEIRKRRFEKLKILIKSQAPLVLRPKILNDITICK